MKFKNKITGSILEPNSKFVEEQMIKSDLYEEVKKVKETKATKKKRVEE